MAQATLSWTPFAVSSPVNASVIIGQRVEYRDARQSTNTWQTAPGLTAVSAATATAIVTGLSDDVPYEFRVVTVCTAGETPSGVIAKLSLSCPTVTAQATPTTLVVNFTPATTLITGVTLTLLDATGNQTIATKSLTPAGLLPLSQNFTGLIPDTAYLLKLTVIAGSTQKTCPLQNLHTTVDAAVSCPAPSGVSASVTT